MNFMEFLGWAFAVIIGLFFLLFCVLVIIGLIDELFTKPDKIIKTSKGDYIEIKGDWAYINEREKIRVSDLKGVLE